MSPIGPKPVRLQLEPALYDKLRQQVLRRDGWRCQSCGAMSNLEVHHKEFRSRLGDDSEGNLIALCTVCHANVHRARLSTFSRHPHHRNFSSEPRKQGSLKYLSHPPSEGASPTSCSRVAGRPWPRMTKTETINAGGAGAVD